MKGVLSLWRVLQHPLNKNRRFFTLAKIIFWKCNQLFFKWPVIVTLTKGVRCICYPDSSFGGLVIYTTSPEYTEHKLFELLVTKDTTVLDVGANIGFVSLMATPRTQKQMYAFEIDSRVLPLLHENIRLNNFSKKILVVEAAVAEKNGIITFKNEATSETSHIGYPKDNSKGSAQKVKAISLDSFVIKNKIAGSLLIKIDVEGAEFMVFKGMKKLLKDKKAKAILFEINQNCSKYGYSIQEMISLIRSYKYSIINLDTKSELTEDDVLAMTTTAINVLAIDNKQVTRSKVASLLTRL